MSRPSLPGRNDPCPCGSGRKFKQCCLQVRTLEDSVRLTLRGAEGRVVPAILDFTAKTFGQPLFDHACIVDDLVIQIADLDVEVDELLTRRPPPAEAAIAPVDDARVPARWHAGGAAAEHDARPGDRHHAREVEVPRPQGL